MSRTLFLPFLLVSCAGGPAAAPPFELPGLYYRMLQEATEGLEARLETEGVRAHTGAVLAGAVLYASAHPANPCRGDRTKLGLALRAGDLMAVESESGRMTWLNHRWLLAGWIDAWRLLEKELGDERRARWRREIEKHLKDAEIDVAERENFPRYASPFIRTSPNHLSIWASTLYQGGQVFGIPEWLRLGGRVMNRFVREEQAPDGYWGEHSEAGPTTGYNFLTTASVALYWEHSRDPDALAALRRATDFHSHFTWPDGTPVEVINDRNRQWGASPWGHFGFSNFPDGRRFAAFLTGILRGRKPQGESLTRIAQNALYFHEGAAQAIPRDREAWTYRMKVPAAMRKEGRWWVCLSGLLATPSPRNQFYLDRQGHLSVTHEKTGLIVTGANSKHQPELATFSETIQGQVYHLPLSGRLESTDRLSLSYNSFWADLEVRLPSARKLDAEVRVTEMGRIEEAQLTLQLVLKAGETLETASKKIVLGADRVELGPEDVGGTVRHRGWTMRVDPSARLVWPVFPFNPYANGPETRLEHAVGALSVPLRCQPGAGRLRTQRIEFSIEVAEPETVPADRR